MAWERKIPFGYRMEKGAIVCEQTEAEAVKHIFSLYLNGQSLSQITVEMTRCGPRYHREKAEWNKNMVKRILENRHYQGDELYPGIVTKEIFTLVQDLKERKNVYAPCPPRIAAVQDKLVCESCGGPVKRVPAGNGKAYWKCRDPQCGNSVRFSDEELGEKLECGLRAAARMPLALGSQSAASQPLSALRLENELNAALNRSGESREYLRSLIYALAAERYRSLPDESASHMTMRCCRKAEDGSWGSLRELLDTAVSTVRIGRSRTLTLCLKNGMTVTEEGEMIEA